MNYKEIQNILSKFSVGIAGAGGLGSNCAVALVRSGIGHLVIADFDTIESGNLNRQYYFRDQIGKYKVDALKDNLLRINPDLKIDIHKKMLNSDSLISTFNDVSVLIEAFDLAEQKERLVETALEAWPDRPLVMGVGMAGYGKTEKLKIHVSGNLYICGDGIEEIGPDNPPIAPRVGIVANMQADKTVELLLKKYR
ncbi:MAG: sulfur carrier protein ThiS adenylyltransferase ThiF [Bacteroidales bacterium]|nr:sulfur carrier protein ThiS adenylyltransferase ThiF [Bacteroidales bacterium]